MVLNILYTYTETKQYCSCPCLCCHSFDSLYMWYYRVESNVRRFFNYFFLYLYSVGDPVNSNGVGQTYWRLSSL